MLDIDGLSFPEEEITASSQDGLVEIDGWLPQRLVIRKFPAKVVGVTVNNDDGSSRQDVVRGLVEGQRVRLVWSRNNVHDVNAIACFPGVDDGIAKLPITTSQQFGHLKSDLAADIVSIYREYRTSPIRVYAEVLKVLTPHTEDSSYGVVLTVYIFDGQYEDVDRRYSYHASPYLWNSLCVLELIHK